jgi:hypothetical protein
VIKVWNIIKAFFVNYGMIFTVIGVVGYLGAPRFYEAVDTYMTAQNEKLLLAVDDKLDDQQYYFDSKIDSLMSTQNVTTIKIDSLKYQRLLQDFRIIQGELVTRLPIYIKQGIDTEIQKLTLLGVRVVNQYGEFKGYEYYLVIPPQEGKSVELIKIESPVKLNADEKNEK